MAKSNKFGAFSGVFTPSILTILGVIMYMRLGWVVGQAGLIATIGIILIAHIISVTTGLSISSIATDKKIKAGGIYYMLSRTLGLPMGGAIGITLFLGTALSISLYIIGFAESFLSIPAIADFLHLQPGVESYRIVGTAVIILLVILAFISTSLAMKSQYLVLGVIVLSLVSIFVGFFIHPELMPQKPLMGMAKNGVSLEMVFAIFFPAVTGFTAGVAMSGDLKDPKKNIPIGTIMAIVVGFIVYMSMAIGFAYFVNRNDLIGDTNIVLKVGWIPALVIAGIWGATLSSALGGILGGPRILQALSQDRVMPKIFGKGYGSSNEPRNALLLIFLIAEGGILIGELNLIAGIVTMFYLTSYGFINLAYVLESWASTDFRPSFKVSKVFGVVGFVFAFAIMFKLDILSMLAAFAITGGIYFILKRRQLKLEFGDVWQSVWNSVVRRGLKHLSVKSIEERNWQPNIILCSGGTKNRPYLIEFGKSLVGKFGMLSNFDLVEDPSADLLFPKYEQRQQSDESESGIFTRKQSCKDIYDGIEMIARTYGFSGIEPNTIILGWARQTKNPDKFQKLLRTINSLDYNVLLIDYDKRYGYGDHNKIDIWWRGEGNNGTLALTLVKFMVASSYWENAEIRLMIISFENDKASYIHRRADEILSEMRIEAEVKVINNQIEQKAVYDIIRVESKSADIVFAGIPEINDDNETGFIEKTNRLLHEIGTVVLLRASSVFKNMSLGVNKEQEAVMGISIHHHNSLQILNIEPSRHESMNLVMDDFALKINAVFNNTYQNFVLNQATIFTHFYEKFKTDLNDNLNVFQKNILRLEHQKINRLIVNYHHILFNKLNRSINEFKAQHFNELKTLLETVIADFDEQIQPVWKALPETVQLSFPRNAFLPQENDSMVFRMYKRRQLRKSKKDFVIVPFALRKYIQDTLPLIYTNLIETVAETGINTVDFLLRFQKFLNSLSLEYGTFRNLTNENKLTVQKIEEHKKIILNQLNEIDQVIQDFPDEISAYFKNLLVKEINAFIDITADIRSVYYHENNKNLKQELKKKQLQLPTLIVPYFSNFSLLFNKLESENLLLQYHEMVNAELNVVMNIGVSVLSEAFLRNIDAVLSRLQGMLKERKQDELPFDKLMHEPDAAFKKMETAGHLSLKRIRRTLKMMPEEITVMDEASFNDFFNSQFKEINTINISFLQMLEFLTENKIATTMVSFRTALQTKVQAQLELIREHYRLFLFSLDEYAQEDTENKESVLLFLNEKLDNIKENKKQIETALKQYEANITELKSEISKQTTLYGLTKFESNLKHYIHEQREVDKISVVKQRTNKLGLWFSSQIVRFKYGKTEVLSYAKILKQDTGLPDLKNRLTAINYNIHAGDTVLKQVPFYYRQLFSAKQTFHREFWVEMKKELEMAERAYRQYQNLHDGALLISGEHHSGKSFLSYMIAHKWNEAGRVVFISPPVGGSIDFQAFDNAIAEAFQTEKYTENLFNSLPKGSFVIFEDIELWWQRTADGLIILKHLLRLVNKYSSRIFFMLNINLFGYRLLEKLLPFDTVLLGVVNINPMPVQAIKDMVLMRHRGTGIDFVYKNQKSDQLSAVKLADLFVHLYKFSNGNAGVVLSAWLSSIKQVDGEVLKIEPPMKPNTDSIHQLSPEIKLILINLLLHKQSLLHKLAMVLELDDNKVEAHLQFLWRMGLVNKIRNEVYEINIYWYPVIVEYLISKNFI